MLGIDLSSQEKEEKEETAAKLVENDAETEMEQGESGLQLDAEPADVDMAEPEAKVEHASTTEVTIVEIREYQVENDPVEPVDDQVGGIVDDTEAEVAGMNDHSAGTTIECGEGAISGVGLPGKVSEIDGKTVADVADNSADKDEGAGDSMPGHKESPTANKGFTDKEKHSGASPSPSSAKQAKDKQPEPVIGDKESLKEPEPVVEEICVKKIISMDTDDTEQDETAKTQSAEETIETSVHMEIADLTTEEACKELPAQKSPLVEEPEAAESEGTEESEKDDGKKSKNESYGIEEMEVLHERVEESVSVEKSVFFYFLRQFPR